MSKSRDYYPDEIEGFVYRPEELGKMFRDAHDRSRLNRKDFAALLNVAPPTVRNWREGRFDASSVRLINAIFGQAGDVKPPDAELNDEYWRKRARRAEAALITIKNEIIEYGKEVNGG